MKRLAGKIDRVLVDAPCSGLGTLRRNPDLKWRQSPEGVEEMSVKQAAILRAAATLVKPGGRLVYATCSLLPEENEEIVAAFMAQHPAFEPLSCAGLLKQQGIAHRHRRAHATMAAHTWNRRVFRRRFRASAGLTIRYI